MATPSGEYRRIQDCKESRQLSIAGTVESQEKQESQSVGIHGGAMTSIWTQIANRVYSTLIQKDLWPQGYILITDHLKSWLNHSLDFKGLSECWFLYWVSRSHLLYLDKQSKMLWQRTAGSELQNYTGLTKRTCSWQHHTPKIFSGRMWSIIWKQKSINLLQPVSKANSMISGVPKGVACTSE